jgi:hypothetical protein
MVVDIATVHALTQAISEARAGNVTGAIVIRFVGDEYEVSISGSARENLDGSHSALTTARACLLAEEATTSAGRTSASVLKLPQGSCSEGG